jgi:transmembrane sensor
MLDNKYCKVEDFLLDDTFVEWVLGKSAEQDIYWESFLEKRPECVGNLKQASSIILSFKIKPVKELLDQQVEEVIMAVKSRLHYNQHDKIVYLPKRNLLDRRLLRYAALVTAFISTCFMGYFFYKSKHTHSTNVVALQIYQQVINKSEVPMLVKLPDHSSVILKPDAQLRYPNFFTGLKREVYLVGEAFFEVSKNSHKPFFVYSDELTVRVVGTSFTVRAIKNDKQYKIIVSTGRVEVSAFNNRSDLTNKKSEVVLTANQQAVLFRSDLHLEKVILKKPLLLSKESTTIHFNFISTPFTKVISTIEEAYGVKIVYDEKVMGNCQLTASLIDQPLDERLRLICQAVEAEYKIVDGHIVIDGKGCN